MADTGQSAMRSTGKRKRKAKPVPKKHRHVASRFFGGTSHYFDPHAHAKGGFARPLLSGSPHTLLLGTQASDNSLDAGKCFFTNENVFWHILGDALGFRRGFHLHRTEAVASIRPHLLHPASTVCSYEAALDRLHAAGFSVWDIIAESERGGSLDQNIRRAKYHDVRALVREHPTIQRIGFATGAGSATIFRKAWLEWLATPGAFRVAPDRASQAVFSRHVVEAPAASGDDSAVLPIELVVLESVSPAAVPAVAVKCTAKRTAGYVAEGRTDLVASGAPRASSYAWKRARWLEALFSGPYAESLHHDARAILPFGSQPTDFENSAEAGGSRVATQEYASSE